MNRIFNFQIHSDEQGYSIEQYLRSLGYSRHIITHIKRTEQSVLLNGKWVYMNQKLNIQDELEIKIIEENPSENIVPSNLPLSILYEDEDILVINKAADMPVHPSINNYDNTLANAVAYYYSKKGEAFVYRCITRLDRDTTGVLLIAKNMVSAAILSQMMVNRQIHRTYLAIVEGIPVTSGTIDAPIGRKEGSTIERQIDIEHGERAVTHYELVKSNDTHSLVKLNLETGRTHQIRVHMKYIGHPLSGDFLYNPDFKLIQRQALHSAQLTFDHPITHAPLSFDAPLPLDMQII